MTLCDDNDDLDDEDLVYFTAEYNGDDDFSDNDNNDDVLESCKEDDACLETDIEYIEG